MALDRSSPLPLYAQVKQILEERLDSGEWKPGMHIPSESELCEEFEVSRITIRQALSELVKEGRLTRMAGRGTYVTQPTIAIPLTKLTSFSQDMIARQRKPGNRVLESSVIAAPLEVASCFGIAPGTEVALLKRLRLADDEPMAIEICYLSLALFPDILSHQFEDQSLYKLLKKKYGIIPTRAEQQIEAITCPNAEAELLHIPRRSPVLHMYRKTFSQDDLPIEWVESFYRGDRYVFHVELRGNLKDDRT